MILKVITSVANEKNIKQSVVIMQQNLLSLKK